MYTIRARATTAATADACIAQLWNPSPTARIVVVEFFLLLNAALSASQGFTLVSTSARGTPGSTIAPDIYHHSRRAVAPPSGVRLDLAPFNPEPTAALPALDTGWYLTQYVGGGLLKRVQIEVPPGFGLALRQEVAYIGNYDIGFAWYEDGRSLVPLDFNFPTVQR